MTGWYGRYVLLPALLCCEILLGRDAESWQAELLCVALFVIVMNVKIEKGKQGKCKD